MVCEKMPANLVGIFFGQPLSVSLLGISQHPFNHPTRQSTFPTISNRVVPRLYACRRNQTLLNGIEQIVNPSKDKGVDDDKSGDHHIHKKSLTQRET